jgi:hypothetical protein
VLIAVIACLSQLEGGRLRFADLGTIGGREAGEWIKLRKGKRRADPFTHAYGTTPARTRPQYRASIS